MYACEMSAVITAKKLAEEEAKRQAKLAKFAKAMEEFKANLESIDAYVEEKLLEGNGKAELLIDKYLISVDDFWCFAEKSYAYSTEYPYWNNKKMSEQFHLDTYIEYLREHCFTVEIIEKPFMACSSTGKTKTKLAGIHLKISI
jgi:hypothetical protein